MNILHTIPSLGVNSGGPPVSTTLAVKGLRAQGVDAEILTHEASSGGENIIEKEYTHFLPPPLERKFGYSKDFRNYLEKNRKYDLYHCQGVWQYPTYITAKKARKFGKPYVITPRGMLYPQEFERSTIKKKIAMALFQKRDLQQAACIHVTCREEMEHLRDLGITAPVAVIPNPIETKGFLKQPVNSPEKMRLGYLGRIHPRKKVERLLYAWDQLERKTGDKELVIIGAGDDKYQHFLENEAERLQFQNVEFTGFLSGQAKEEKLASLSYLVVPSNFENFGMIIAEALVRGIPVIASKGTPWQDLETYDCGWWVNNDVKTLKEKIEEAMNIEGKQRINMARNGKKLIEEKYTVDSIGHQLKKVYSWLIRGRTKPDYVSST